MISLSELAKTLLKSKSVGIICHVRPDGDTLGSAYALASALTKKGIAVKVFCDDSIPEKFEFLLKGQTPFRELNLDLDLLVAIDCADAQRTGAFAQGFVSHKNTLVIDHHVSNTRFAKQNYVSPYSANCINVYYVIKELGVEIDEEIANYLACGIMTDTGRFCHKDVQPVALTITAELMEKGANLNQINRWLFSRQTKNRAKLLGKVLSSLRFFCDGRVVVATILQSDLQLTGAKADETEGFIEQLMGIVGVEVGASLLEMDANKYKISFRSNGEVDVNAVAQTYGGGGHVLASGCQISGELEEVVDKVTFTISRHLKDYL